MQEEIKKNVIEDEENTEVSRDIIAQVASEPTEEEKAALKEMEERNARVQTLRKDYRVSIETPYPEEQCLLMIEGVGFLAKGDIHALKAKQKSGKTNAIAIMVAAILCGQWNRLEAALQNAKVLFIDTEQKAADTQAIYRKILKIAGLPEEDIFERFEIYTLRKQTSQERLQAVKDLILDYKPDIVFIDGIVDLSIDFNEVGDSQEIIQLLMRLSTEVDCAIVNVLHTNKALEDHNMRGHLGTMLGQKAGNVLECVKSEGGYITVRSADARHAPVPEWSFCFTDDGELECADDRVVIAAVNKARDKAERKEYERQKTEDSRVKICKQVFAENGSLLASSEFKKLYASKAGINVATGRRHIAELLHNEKLIEEKGMVRLPGVEEQKLQFKD